MATEKDFCTVLDKLLDHKDFLMLIHKTCLSSLLSNVISKKIVLVPSKDHLKTLEKKTKNEIRTILMRHILNTGITQDKLKEMNTVNVGTQIKNNRYDVVYDGKDTITVDGIKAKLDIVARNGSIYVINGLLKENIVERPTSRKRSRAKQYGGGGLALAGSNLMPLVSVDGQMIHPNDGGLEVRHLFIDELQNNFGNQWANQGLAELLVYLNSNIGNVKEQYLPLLGGDPTASLEILLDIYTRPWNSNQLVIDQGMFSDFTMSPYYLSQDPSILGEASSIFGSFTSGLGSSSSMFENIKLDSQFINRSRSILQNVLGNPQRIRDFGNNVLNIYKIMLGEPNRFNPGHTRIFKKLWNNPAEGLLKNDLLKFVSARKYNMSIPYSQRYNELSNIFGKSPNEVINSFLKNNLINNYSGATDIFGGLSNFGGLGSLSDYESYSKFNKLWVDSNQFLNSVLIDLNEDNSPFSSIYSNSPSFSSFDYSSNSPFNSLNISSSNSFTPLPTGSASMNMFL